MCLLARSTKQVGSQSPVDELEGVEEATMTGDMLAGEELVSKVSECKHGCEFCMCVWVRLKLCVYL